MAHKKKWKNPFYALLIPAGMVFIVTACAYGFMAFQMVNSGSSGANLYADHPLFSWLRTHGNRAMLIELAVLAVLTVGSIATDRRWTELEDTPKHDMNDD